MKAPETWTQNGQVTAESHVSNPQFVHILRGLKKIQKAHLRDKVVLMLCHKIYEKAREH